MSEIERRFLVSGPLPSNPERETLLWQGYLFIEGSTSFRIRRADSDEYWEALKYLPDSATTLVRDELEFRIDAAQFEERLAAVRYRPIEKIRRDYRLPTNHLAEVDTFSGALDGLVIVEVEFASTDDAAAFAPPAWFGQEVTEDRAYLNTSLAQWGIPDSYHARL